MVPVNKRAQTTRTLDFVKTTKINTVKMNSNIKRLRIFEEQCLRAMRKQTKSVYLRDEHSIPDVLARKTKMYMLTLRVLIRAKQ